MKGLDNFMLRSAVALVLGLLLVLWPGDAVKYLVVTIGVLFFVTVLMYLLGVILALAGIEEIVALMRTRRLTPVPFLFFLMPIVVLIAGIVVLFYPFKVASAAFAVLGVFSIIYAVSEFVSGMRFRRFLKGK